MIDRYELNEIELLVLLAVARLPEAYGVTVQREIGETGGRRLSITAVYAALERLEGRGLLDRSLTEPTPERGGRRKRVYTVLAEGELAVARARRGLERMWDGIGVPDLDPA